MGLLIQLFLAFFIASTVISMIKGKKQQSQAMAEYQAKLEKYESITVEQIENGTDDDVIEAITFHMLDKVNSNYDEALKAYNEVEKQFFTLYQLQLACQSPRGSINDFFVNAKELVKYAPIIFDEIGMHEGTHIFNEARGLYLRYEEEYKRDIDEVLEEYESGAEIVVEEKNFGDYSKELNEIFVSETFKSSVAKYLREHAIDFVEEGDGSNEERISTEV